MKKKQKTWCRPRHKVITELARWVLSAYVHLRYNIRIRRFPGKGQYLILLNHQTPFDQFFVGMAFYGPVYYMATEDIFSLGWVSSLLRWAIAPVPIKKQTTDLNAVMNCLRIAREGGTICIAPEGNRTYSGRTEYMNPAIVGLAKKLHLPIALYRIEGGYGAEPRWSDCVRRGPMRGYVSQVIQPEEYDAMTNQALQARIEEGLFVNEAVEDFHYHSNKRAEYLERAIYVCPFCGLAEFESHGNTAKCLRCGREVEYGTDKKLTGIGCDFPFTFMAQWYDYQKDFINTLDVTRHTAQPLYRDRAELREVIVYRRKELLHKNASVALYGDRVVIEEGTEHQLVLPFAEITAAAVLGKNKLNLYHNKKVYQFKGSKRFNALKYVHICFRCKNIARGEENSTFLGL
jgi:1-acyl-sn-glycerol-3-phosphate acyltransferase